MAQAYNNPNPKPETRLREFTPDRHSDRIDGILVGFAEMLHLRNQRVDIITTRRARMEIMDFVLIASKNPEVLKQVKEERKLLEAL